MRARGWTEAEVAERIMPFMPPGAAAPAGEAVPPGEAASAGAASPPARPAISVPRRVSTEWLDRRLGAMEVGEIRVVVDELERRGWPPTELAAAVLPHLLPKLSPADARAILSGLRELGMTEEELARLHRPV